MKTNTPFKVLTLASLLFYSGVNFAQGTGNNYGNNNTGNFVDPEKASITKKNDCIDQLNANAGLMIPHITATTQLNTTTDDFKKARESFPDAYDTFTSCLAPSGTNANSKQISCDKAREQTKKDADLLVKACKNAPKVDASKLVNNDDDSVIDTASPDTTSNAKWGRCLQNATSCEQHGFQENESANKCAESNFEDLLRTNPSDKEIKTYCEDHHPQSCGPLDKVDLRNTAKDLKHDLDADSRDLKREIAEKTKEIKQAQDAATAADKKAKELPNKFAQMNKASQDLYEATVKKNGDQIDAGLEGQYKKIASDVTAVKEKTAAVSQADTDRFDASTKMKLACDKIATAYAQSQYPSGGVNYGDGSALITSKANRANAYSNKMAQLLANNGVDCDGGAYAHMQVAISKAELDEKNAEAQVLQDQSTLQIMMQQNVSKKSDANYKALTDQVAKATQMAQDQQSALQDAVTEAQNARKDWQTAQDELNKLNQKLSMVPTKEKCINTLNQCAASSVIPEGKKSDVSDLTEAPELVDQVITDCKIAATKCNGPYKGTSDGSQQAAMIQDLTADFTQKADYDPPSGFIQLLPYDKGDSNCIDAIRSKLDASGPVNPKKRPKRSTTPKATDKPS